MLAGGENLCAAVRREKENAENRHESPSLCGLSHLQRTIAELLLQGKMPRDIAAELGATAAQTYSHLHQLYAAFNLPNGQLVLLAIRLHEQRAILGIRCEACSDP